MNIYESVTATGGPLAEQDLRAAVDSLLNAPYEPDPCKLGRHVVSPTAKARGYGICANCMAPVGAWPTDEA